jgi:hypothetical protein
MGVQEGDLCMYRIGIGLAEGGKKMLSLAFAFLEVDKQPRSDYARSESGGYVVAIRSLTKNPSVPGP